MKLLLFAAVAALSSGVVSQESIVKDGFLSLLGLKDSPTGNTNWNLVADFILDALKDEVRKTGKEQIPLPDVDQSFRTKIKFLNVTGTFSARHGWFRNLSTVERTADVTLTTEGKVYTLSCALGMGEVELGFDQYDVTLNTVDITVSGRINGSVGTNSISLVARVDTTAGKCNATLQEIRIRELDDVKLTLTGFGVLNSLASKLADSIIEKRKGDIIKRIEIVLATNVAKALQTVHC